ncbi:hypothetical protein [Leptospira andrefontaineae]|uniref:Uncharacterized protein n=1 Tax=Leptospira andrefontaineae TaxID=2484976 RepID=A0A4R9GWV2_9LEPT|nr:hypothetical protein [Leptospira andrefontaineae]TGK36245.1 hypothetical protein EHO65_18250 [Leptospira andrefontaineae]
MTILLMLTPLLLVYLLQYLRRRQNENPSLEAVEESPKKPSLWRRIFRKKSNQDILDRMNHELELEGKVRPW